MNKCTLTVSLAFGDKYITKAIDLDPLTIGKTMTSLDHPSPNADFYDRMLCTDRTIINFVMSERRSIANNVARHLAEAIINVLANEDKIMGYPIREDWTQTIVRRPAQEDK